MAQGNQRREGVKDSLAGSTVEVTSRSAAPLSVPQVRTPDVMNSQASKIGRALGQFSSQAFQNAANVQHEAAALDGQMAQMQGQAIEEVEMEGDKWKLSGYRLMDAQSISASMLAAQQEMIRQSQYEDDPDQFRATFVNRLEQQIEGLDPQTASLVRKQMASQLPALVGQHTTAYMANQEKEAYEALERSVDIIGKDETQLDNFIANVKGEGGSGGLSQDRRTSAVTNGVVRAFQAGNPVAFARIKRADLRSEFSTQEWAAMENAEKAYQSKLRETLNKDYIAEMTQFELDVAEGKIRAEEAVAMQEDIMSKHGMKMTMNEGKAASMEAQSQREIYKDGNAVLYKDAIARGDYAAVAELSFDTVVWYESKGKDVRGPVIQGGANKGDRAIGPAQVMPKTAANPGYGIRPADLNDPQDVYRVGRELWARHIRHYKGDVEAAAIAYNAGPGHADEWLAAGRDYSVLPKREETEPYAKGILADVTGGGRTISASNRLATAEAQAKATSELLGIQEYVTLTEATDALTLEYNDPASKMTDEQFWEKGLALLEATDQHFTKANINALKTTVDQHRSDAEAAMEKAAKEAEKASDEDAKLRIKEQQQEFKIKRNAADAAYEVSMAAANEAGDWRKALQITEEYNEQLSTDLNDSGLTLAESGAAAEHRKATQATAKALIEAQKTRVKNGVIDRAIQTGTVADLPDELRAEAHKKMNNQTQTDLSEAKSTDTDGAITPELEQQIMADEEVKNWQQAGEVDPVRRAEMTQQMHPQRLLAQDGTANPEVVSLITQYNSVVESNGRKFADTMFSDTATQLRAEHIRRLANNSSDPAAIAQAIVQVATAPENTTKFKDGKPSQELLDDAAEYARGIRESGLILEGVHGDADVGIIQSMLSGDLKWNDRYMTSPTETAQREQYREQFASNVEDRIIELSKIAPYLSAKDLGNRAQRDVQARTTFIGGDMIYADKPSDTPRAHMFGSKAGDFPEPYHENRAVIQWLAKKSEEEGFGFITNTMFREGLPFNAGSLVPNIVNFFGGSMTEPEMGFHDSWTASARKGVRNLDHVTLYGTDGAGNVGLKVFITDIDGNVNEVVVDMEEAGKDYMEWYKQDAINNQTVRDKVSGAIMP